MVSAARQAYRLSWSDRFRQGIADKSVSLLGRFFVNDITLVLAYQIDIDELTCDGFPTHAICFLYYLDFLARISHEPFIEKISKRGKVVIALQAVYSVIDCNKFDTFFSEK